MDTTPIYTQIVAKQQLDPMIARDYRRVIEEAEAILAASA